MHPMHPDRPGMRPARSDPDPMHPAGDRPRAQDRPHGRRNPGGDRYDPSTVERG